MNQTSIEINGNLHFSQIWNGEIFWNFTNYLKYENAYFQIKIFNEITLLLFMIYSFIKIWSISKSP